MVSDFARGHINPSTATEAYDGILNAHEIVPTTSHRVSGDNTVYISVAIDRFRSCSLLGDRVCDVWSGNSPPG
jgi:hypothetical protein